MEIRYLENLRINSIRTFENFKRENVFNSKTLQEMFSPKFIYKGIEPDVVLVKSIITNKPTKIRFKKRLVNDLGYKHYDYVFFDNANNIVGKKNFYITNANEMKPGYMESSANEVYYGLGVREEELQIKDAIEHEIDYIPRASEGGATLYHTKMGYLPMVDDLIEVKNENDVRRYMKGLKRKSKDLKPENLVPIIIEKDGHYYIDVNKTQAIANVREIKQRLASGDCTKHETRSLDLDGVWLSLSGEQFDYWKNLINLKK